MPDKNRMTLSDLVDRAAIATVRSSVKVVNKADEVLTAVGTILAISSSASMSLFHDKSAKDVVDFEADQMEEREAKREKTAAQLVAKFEARQAKRNSTQN